MQFRTVYGVLRQMARLLRRRGVTHVAMEACGIYIDPVYSALCELYSPMSRDHAGARGIAVVPQVCRQGLRPAG